LKISVASCSVLITVVEYAHTSTGWP